MASYPKEQMTYQEVVPTPTQSNAAAAPTTNMAYGNPAPGPGNQTLQASQGFGRQEMGRQFRGRERPKWLIPVIVGGVVLVILAIIGVFALLIWFANKKFEESKEESRREYKRISGHDPYVS